MLVPRFFRKAFGFSVLELLLVIVIIVVLCGSFYIFKYTDILNSLFNNNQNKQTQQSIFPNRVSLPIVTHNQLIMSLTGASLETSKADGSFLFPFNANKKIATEWPINAGFLVKSNEEGYFDLLGYRYRKTDKQFAQDGYDALLNLDTNSDDILDSLDVDYDKLYFWQDVNNNGVIDQNEVRKLTDLGIVAINLSSGQKVNEKINNSVITKKIAFIKEDDSQGILLDTDLFQNPYYREYLIKLPLDDDIKKLPNVAGTGSVRDLQEAVTLNPQLLSLLIDYLIAGATDRRFIRMDKLLFEWARTSDFPSFNTRLEDILTPHFDLVLDDKLSLQRYEEGLNPQQDLIRKIMIIENFTSKRLLHFFSQEVLNSSSQQWELHFIVSFGQQVIVSQVIQANQGVAKTKVLITTNMFQFTPEQTLDIYSQYNQLKRDTFNRIQTKANSQIGHLYDKNQKQWLDLKLKNQIDTGEIYQQKYSRPVVDIPRRRHLMECMKPNNNIDGQVIDCAAGKISKTWK